MTSNSGMTRSFPRHKISLEGVVSLLLTPFQEDGSINWKAYDTYLNWQLSMKPDGLFAVCGSSEMAWLTQEERLELARRAVDRSGSTPVIATANLEPDSEAHYEEVARMASTGVDGVVLIPRSDLAHTPEQYLDYLLTLTERAELPVFLYEWPQVEHHLLDSSLVAKLAPYISGVKDTTCTPEGIQSKVDVADDMVVYQANTPYLPEAISMGAGGYMAITSTCYADLALDAWRAWQNKDDARAARMHRELVFLDNLLVRAYPATAKYIVSERGIHMEAYTRWPNTFSREFSKAIDVWMASLPEAGV